MKKILLTTILSTLMIVFLPTSVVNIGVVQASHNASESQRHSTKRRKPRLECLFVHCQRPGRQDSKRCAVYDRQTWKKVKEVKCRDAHKVHCSGGCAIQELH